MKKGSRRRKPLPEPAPGMSPSIAAVPPAGPAALVDIATTWLVLAAVEIALTWSVGAGSRPGDLSLAARPGLAAAGLLALLLAIGGVRGLLWPATFLARTRPAGGRWIAAVYRGTVVWVALLFWMASWATFWQTGLFLDRDAVEFWAVQPVQVLHWVYPPVLIALLGVNTALALVLGWWLPRWTANLRLPARRGLVAGAAMACVACVLMAAAGLAGGGLGQLDRSSSALGGQPAAHAGPILHAVVDSYRRSAFVTLATAEADDRLDVERRPIISLEEYAARVDRSRMRRFNVLMIQIESLRADQLRVYGGVRDVMPTLDALARESRAFSRAYIQASHSNYAGLVPLSSQYPLRSAQMYTYPENPSYPRVLIYDVLKALGYRTAIVSSQNERWGAMINFHRPASLDHLFHAATYAGPTYTPWEDIGFAQWVAQTEGAGSVDDRYTVDEALRWLDEGPGEPFFLHMNLQSSHLPYVVPSGFPRRFGPDTLDFTILWGKFPLDKVDVVKDRYADSLFYIDAQIARLFEGLRRMGLWDDTVIVIGGDNGEAFYEHGFSAHASWLFDEVVKVPMLVRVPGLAAGVDARPAMFLDVPPSLLDVLQLPPHPGFQGISLFAPQFDPERSMFMIAQTPAAYETAIVRGRYKLHWAEMENLYVLNDLVTDPGETSDIGAVRPTVVTQMAARLQQWRTEQLAYYGDVNRQSREYPPFFRD